MATRATLHLGSCQLLFQRNGVDSRERCQRGVALPSETSLPCRRDLGLKDLGSARKRLINGERATVLLALSGRKGGLHEIAELQVGQAKGFRKKTGCFQANATNSGDQGSNPTTLDESPGTVTEAVSFQCLCDKSQKGCSLAGIFGAVFSLLVTLQKWVFHGGAKYAVSQLLQAHFLGWHFAAHVLPPDVGEDSLASALCF
jgi:hypothetical protein